MIWLITLLSIAGVWLNIKKHPVCFVIWMVTNCSWMMIDLDAGLYAQAVVFFVYFILSIYGFLNWSNQERETHRKENRKKIIENLTRLTQKR